MTTESEMTNPRLRDVIIGIVNRARPQVLELLEEFCRAAERIPPVHPAIVILGTACAARRAQLDSRRRRR